MKHKHSILIAILVMFTATCLMLVACSKQENESVIVNPPIMDFATMTLGQLHNHAVEIMWTQTGTIEERMIATLHIMNPAATPADEQQLIYALRNTKKIGSTVLTPDEQGVLDDLAKGLKNIDLGDYKSLYALYDEISVKHKSQRLENIIELHRSTFDIWTNHPEKRLLPSSENTIADVGTSLIIGFYFGSVPGAIVGAAASIWYAETMAECRSHCVSDPYYGPNPACC